MTALHMRQPFNFLLTAYFTVSQLYKDFFNLLSFCLPFIIFTVLQMCLSENHYILYLPISWSSLPLKLRDNAKGQRIGTFS